MSAEEGSLVTGGGQRHGLGKRASVASAVVLAALALGAAILAAVAATARASSTFTVTVAAAGTHSSANVGLDSMTYSQAVSALGSVQASSGTAALPVAPSTFPGVTSHSAVLATNDSSHTLTVTGPVTILGSLPAQVIVVAQWSGATAASPAVSVLFKTGTVELATLTGADTALTTTFDSALLGLTASATPVTVVRAGLPSASQSFLASDFTVGPGVTMRADATAGNGSDLGNALGKLGLSSVEFDGTLSLTAGEFASAGDGTSALDLSATVTPVRPSDWPPDVTLSSGTLSIAAQDGNFGVTLTGGATITAGGTPYPATATVTVGKTGSGVAIDLNATLGQTPDLFGVSWLSLDGAKATITTKADNSITANLSGAVHLAGTSFTFGTSLASANAEKLDASLSSSGPIGITSLARAVSAGSLPAGLPDWSLSKPSVALAIDRTSSGTTVQIGATATAQVTIGNTTTQATVLLRAGSGGVTVAARPPGSLTLADLGITAPGNPQLPDLAVTLSTATLKEPSASLDAATRAYFAGALCGSSTPGCDFSVDVPKGAGIEARVVLPSQVTSALGEIGLATNEPLRVDGQVPLFGNHTVSLAVHLPVTTVTQAASYLRGTALGVTISGSPSSVSFGLSGAITVGVPRVYGSCTSSDVMVSSTACVDPVTFSVSATISVGGTSGASFALTGSIAGAQAEGWQQPFGISWLTVYDGTVELSVATSPETEVQLGFGGRIVVGSKDLDIGIKVGITPEPPFVDFDGFTGASKAGVSMADLASLYSEISGHQVSTTALPPVDLKNLFLSFGHVSDPALCLRPGFYLSGDLYLTSSGTQAGDYTPSCLPPSTVTAPGRSQQCMDDSTCLASVLVDVGTGLDGSTAGITAQGSVTGWTAGPLTFAPTDLDLELNAAQQRVYISGGATLLDPATYKLVGAKADTWATGNLTLDVQPTRLYLHGDAQLTGGQPITIQAAGNLSLTDPGFNLDTYLPSGTLQHITAGASGAITWVKDTADTFGSSVDATDPGTLVGDFSNALSQTGSSGPSTWQQFYGDFGSVQTKIRKINSYFTSLHLPAPLPVSQIVYYVLHGFSVPSALGGGHVPGLCAIQSFASAAGTACAAQDPVSGVKQQYVYPAVDSQLQTRNITVPAGATTSQLVDRFESLPAGNPPAATCAVAPVSYANGTVGDLQVDMQALGMRVAVDGGKLQNAGTTGTAHTVAQHTVNALVTGATVGGCTGTPPPAPVTPQLTLSVNKSVVPEGSAVTVTGRVIDGTGAGVTLAWGDGSADTTVTPGADGAFTASHTYVDNPGPGESATVTITASTAGAASVTRDVLVVNVQPSIEDLTVTPSSVNEGSSVTLHGIVTDPGVLDTHTVTVHWGDGTTPSAVTLPPARDGGGAFTLTHTYYNNLPIGQPDGASTITVIATDNDGAHGSATAPVTVIDVPPSRVTLKAPGAINGIGTVFTHAGDTVKWAGTADDPGLQDLLTVGLGWGDGTAAHLRVTPPGDRGPATRTFAASHTWASACFDDVTVTVTDDDGESAPVLHQAVVVTAPLGARAEGPGWWQQQLAALASGHGHSVIPASRMDCYLAIASHVSTVFGKGGIGIATPAQALSILKPGWGGLPKLDQEKAKLDRALLTGLLNFANGAWDWTTVASPTHTAFNALVAEAGTAQSGSDLAAVRAARQQLQRLYGS